MAAQAFEDFLARIDDRLSTPVLNRVILIATLVAMGTHFVLLWAGPHRVGAYQAADIPLLALFVIGGVPILGQLAIKLLRREMGADFLAAIAFVTGVWLGEYLAASLIILMLTGGQVLESFAMRKASSALNALARRMPSVAHRKEAGGDITDIALDDVQINDLIAVFPHETAPVDGTVVDGHGSMDESYLTGEPYVVAKAPGTAVLSGAINGEAVLIIRAEKRARDSRYAQIMDVMAEAEQKRPRIRRLGDQIGAWFAPAALIFAILVGYLSGDSSRFLAVLVVATPCPLLIAIPITVMSAISIAARRGIVIRDPTVLERLPTCQTAIFDKTGTLTYGRPELVDVVPGAGFEGDFVLRLTAGLERYSKHPLASAVLKAAKLRKLPLDEVSRASEKPGQGLSGQVDGHEVVVTHRNKLMKSDPEMAKLLPDTTAGLECVVLINGQYGATFRFRDTPRAEGESFVGHLGDIHHFKKVMLLSGDRESEVSYLSELLGISESLASQSPEQKVAIVRAEAAKAPTLFMGDGINDAPALAVATVGIAFGKESAVTADAAGAVIPEASLVTVDELLHISMAMRRILLQSVIGGMVLSIVAMGFAAAGYITPVAGALLQEGIDIIAILNALRLAIAHDIDADMVEQPNA
ncbi:heavy metal translocating P-type ATPase [Thalassospira profundimaris]|uniref:P-type Zn(2+) transporter n=1 Tax=Thalassospira profundimaris TaxID=502049 RepID=A0A367WX77_9PROT|nr:heavy metal translocating P-type ATPase [Thalassospira profundimaris]RCK45111.1 metal ABC transporter ATPase [Thalassospira profundimaris]